jgi:hypothetical protein
MSDYRLVIAHVLTQDPFNEESVYDCVCTYVRAERDIGRSASDVSVALSDLVERTGALSAAARDDLTRRVIPWCVEAYFGTSEADEPERSWRQESMRDAFIEAAGARREDVRS